MGSCRQERWLQERVESTLAADALLSLCMLEVLHGQLHFSIHPPLQLLLFIFLLCHQLLLQSARFPQAITKWMLYKLAASGFHRPNDPCHPRAATASDNICHDDIAAADLVLMLSVIGTSMSGLAPVQLLLSFVSFLLDSCQLLLQLMVLVSVLWQAISRCNAWPLLPIWSLPLEP